MSVVQRALTLAGVPADLHASALACLAEAKSRARGLAWHKLKARFWHAKRLAKLLPWDAETVDQYVRSEMVSCGIVPNRGNGVNGDSTPWSSFFRMPDGREVELTGWGLPRVDALNSPLWAEVQADLAARRQAIVDAGGMWVRDAPPLTPLELDPDPSSLSYRSAVARNYWCPGHHPRSQKARLAWLRRNGGEREAWARGVALPDGQGIVRHAHRRGRWHAEVLHVGPNIWQVNVRLHLMGKLSLYWRCGYELDNARHAHPRPGYERRACVTWGWRPERARDGEG